MFFNMMLLAVAGVAGTVSPASPDRLYACGDDQVREYRIGDAGAVETWRWSAASAPDLPDAYRTKLLAHIDDCKSVDGGRTILVTASTGGVVLVDRASGRVTFRAKAPMAHSADVMPGGLIAIALSIHAKGDRLELYDRHRSEAPLFTVPLPSGHGAVWDAPRERLFVLSHDLIQAYRRAGTASAPTLVETARWTLPGRHDGHDLSRSDDGRYMVTTDDGVWVFDPATGDYTPFVALNPKLKVKAVSQAGDRLAWVQAEDSWWAKGFQVARADGSVSVRIPVAELHLYKVRWIR